jgi:agmatinase
MSRPSFHGDDAPPWPREKALFHVIPVPLEQTVSYGAGTADGPRAILEASVQLELFDGISIPAEYGIYTADPVDCRQAIAEVLVKIEESVAQCLSFGSIPVILGGEHSLTLGTIRALKKKYGTFGVVQFDAHADLRDSFEGSPHSHACVMRRIVDEDIPIYQIGTRSYSMEEHLFRRERNIWYRDAETVWREGIDTALLPPDCPEKIFITLDVDCFDASEMPATGTPVPGGLTWYQVIWSLKAMLADRICIGFDLVELAPLEKMHGPSFMVAQLAYTLMGYLVRSETNRRFHAL